MNILLCLKDDLLSDVLSLAIEGAFTVETKNASSESDAALLLKDGEKFDLLIVESDLADGPIFEATKTLEIPVIRISDPDGQLIPSDNPRVHLVVKPFELVGLIDLIRQTVKTKNESAEAFCKVSLFSLLASSEKFDFDLYIKLSEVKYVKLFAKNTIIEEEEQQKLLKKGVVYLYVRKEDFSIFLNEITSKLQKYFDKSKKKMPVSEAVDAISNAYEAILEGFSNAGATHQVQGLVKVTVDVALASIQKDPAIRDMLGTFSKRQTGFLSWHSTALCYVSCKLATLMDMDSQSVHFKLILASLLHDISIGNLEAFEMGGSNITRDNFMNDDEWNAFSRHPSEAAEIAKKMKDFPGDVDYIINQHHELPDGSGFPNQLNHTRINPISAVFIVAHDICQYLYVERSKFDLSSFLKKTKDKYNVGNFKKIRTMLEKLPPEQFF